MQRRPTLKRLRSAAKRLGVPLSEEELEDIGEVAARLFDTLDAVVRLPVDRALDDGVIREDVGEPRAEDDPLNAIIRRCSVRRRQPAGSLVGKRIGVKNNIAVAGLPMTCGSITLRDYVPDEDATVITRVIEAGAEVVALLNMDSFASSATGETSAFGPTRNPNNPDYLAGGSSGGSAAALYYSDIDMTLGCDQGGSIRIPASWCGVVGLRPTFGLVPYTGILSGEATLDSVGPMAQTVSEVALLLEAIAGLDGLDPRQFRSAPAGNYTANLGDDVSGLRLGIVTEGFGFDVSNREVDRTVRAAIDNFSRLGIEVSEVSIPSHREAYAVSRAIDIEGGAAVLLAHGLGYGLHGQYSVGLGAALGRFPADGGEDMSPETKFTLLVGKYLSENCGHAFYARAQNYRRSLRRAYDVALEQVDVLAMPTVPFPAQQYEVRSSWQSRRARESGAALNTGPLSATGHPCVSVPCGLADGLPVGLMLSSRHFAEPMLLRVAYAFEQSTAWREAGERSHLADC